MDAMKEDTHLVSLLRSRNLRLADLAHKVGVNKATVTRWSQGKVPLSRVYQVEEETGIPHHELRPDFFGRAAQ
jgi:transcriptional regulator with XRE-family HTH domain